MPPSGSTEDTSWLEGRQGDEVLALSLEVTGTVQGVGFRPFVYRLAQEYGLRGSVRNEGSCVRIEAQAEVRQLEGFLRDLRGRAPAAAAIEAVSVRLLPHRLEEPFTIVPSSVEGGRESMGIPIDAAICPDCLEDLQNPESRYYRYPFTSCTQCGPRYTITRHLPFDRERTAMDRFPLCEGCLTDYRSPASRRFHAQATACQECGPRLFFCRADGRALAEGEDALALTKDLLRAGGIAAIMGVGGFHLAVDARSDAAVRRLRARKQRPGKPLAVMMTEDEARICCIMSPEEERSLQAPAHPIVLLERRGSRGVAPSVAPGMARLGVMLPYTALHVLLLEDKDLSCLVMTSGNHSGEPLSYSVESALRELGDVADGFLCHTREIVRPVDDSVLRVTPEGQVMLRRARGFVPQSIAVPDCDPALEALAVGGDVKNAFAVLRGGRIWLSPHIGDLDVPKTMALFRQEVSWYREELRVEPDLVLHDLHPGYRGTQYAKEQPKPLLGVQHHHAHVAACLLEHGVTEPVIGLALDGVGYGDDGGIWGGEALLVDGGSCRRVGSLRPLRLIGGDIAVKEPWRLAVSYVEEVQRWKDEGDTLLRRMGASPEPARRLLQVLASRYPGFVSTSAGRLFDAAGALILGQATASFEGELPMRLEALVRSDVSGAYPFELAAGERLLLDWRPALSALLDDLRQGETTVAMATRLHRGMAAGLALMARILARRLGLTTVALAGGVWQNEWLLRWFLDDMAASGIKVIWPQKLPAGDGGLAIGQLAVLIARRRLRLRTIDLLDNAPQVEGEAFFEQQ